MRLQIISTLGLISCAILLSPKSMSSEAGRGQKIPAVAFLHLETADHSSMSSIGEKADNRKLMSRSFFFKESEGWKACINYPPTNELDFGNKKTWNIFFDDKIIGELELREIFLYGIAFDVKSRGDQISRLKELWDKGHEPFAINVPNASDPEIWKRTETSQELMGKLREAYLKEDPILYGCSNPKDPEEGQFIKTNNKLSLADLDIHPHSFRSKSGQVLAAVKVKKDKVTPCMMEPAYEPFGSYHWYHVSVDGKVKPISGSYLYDPLDAVDLDGDGRSEWIFKRRNSILPASYALFWSNFKNRVSHYYASLGCSKDYGPVRE